MHPTRRRLFNTFPAFKLERHFAKYEHLHPITHLCASDTESITVRDALRHYADPEVRKLWIDMDLAYTEVKGHPLLLQELASFYNSYADPHLPPLHSEQHVQELAPQEGILLGTLALNCDAASRIIVTSPGYQSLHQIAATNGAQISHWTPRYDPDGGTRFHVDDLHQLASASPEPLRAVVVNFPHNPTGCLPTALEWGSIIAIAKEHDAFLFSDEMYHGLEQSPEQCLTPAVTAYPEKGISLGGVSKSMGMPGARVGWIACRNVEYMQEIASLRDYTTICSSAPSQLLGLLALRAREQLQQRARTFTEQGRMCVARVIQEHQHLFKWGRHGPQAGPMGWVQVNEGVSASDYCHALIESTGIMLLPSNVYECGGDQCFRIGFGRSDTNEVVAVWEQTLMDRQHPATRVLYGDGGGGGGESTGFGQQI